MVFNSLTFIVFFAIVLALHAMPFGWTTRKINLLIASYLFYAAWNPPFVLLLWISTVVDWWAAKQLVHASKPVARRAWMLLSVVANLGMLGYFKYGPFLLDNFIALMATLGVVYRPPAFDIVRPIGSQGRPDAAQRQLGVDALAGAVLRLRRSGLRAGHRGQAAGLAAASRNDAEARRAQAAGVRCRPQHADVEQG